MIRWVKRRKLCYFGKSCFCIVVVALVFIVLTERSHHVQIHDFFGNTTVRESTHKKYRQRMIASELRLDTGSDCVRWAGWNGRKIDSHTIRTSMCTQCAVSVCVVVCFLFGVFVARFIVKAVRSSVCFSMYLMRNDKEITRSSQWIRIINVKTTIIYHHLHYICDPHTS